MLKDWRDLQGLLQERFWPHLDVVELELDLGHPVMPPIAQDSYMKRRQC